jgi:hypothetical protein
MQTKLIRANCFYLILSKQSRSEYTESRRCVFIILVISKEKSCGICHQSYYYNLQVAKSFFSSHACVLHVKCLAYTVRSADQ